MNKQNSTLKERRIDRLVRKAKRLSLRKYVEREEARGINPVRIAIQIEDITGEKISDQTIYRWQTRWKLEEDEKSPIG